MSDAITLTVEHGLARLALARPGNPVNPDFNAALIAAGRELSARDDVRAVVLASDGPAFCVGGDLAWMERLADDAVEPSLRKLADDLHEGMQYLLELDAPVIASVRGAAAGAGMSLVCASDLVIAAESSFFTVAYTAAGLSPDGGQTWFLPRVVGVRKATELMLTNARLSAAEAAGLGIVTRVVPDGDLAAATDELAVRIASGATAAYGSVKRLLRHSFGATLQEQLADEAGTVAAHGAGHDGREGIGAFLAKRR
jgi:2-(1,2-epoxy-1,2-dihydrophenyl)acetyl-CoA isomerase